MRKQISPKYKSPFTRLYIKSSELIFSIYNFISVGRIQVLSLSFKWEVAVNKRIRKQH